MHVTYQGPTQREDLSTEFHVRDGEGEMHVLRQGVPAPVSDELGSELLKDAKDRDARLKGHKFAKSTDEELKQHGLSEDDAAAEPQKPDPAIASARAGSGTTTAAART